jgi:hypothetical protein
MAAFSVSWYFTQSVGLLGPEGGIRMSHGHYLHIGQHQQIINVHRCPASSGIRTRDPSVWAGEDSSCLRPRRPCDCLRNVYDAKSWFCSIKFSSTTTATRNGFVHPSVWSVCMQVNRRLYWTHTHQTENGFYNFRPDKLIKINDLSVARTLSAGVVNRPNHEFDLHHAVKLILRYVHMSLLIISISCMTRECRYRWASRHWPRRDIDYMYCTVRSVLSTSPVSSFGSSSGPTLMYALVYKKWLFQAVLWRQKVV